ncbi:unnamed protein product, partial [Mesorhabditis belari]|uniref:Uncharacterized protein n=1 Tax=Mesorhabditis belari TaxID=2138241 RepID=A0AAF3F1D2_9BILA
MRRKQSKQGLPSKPNERAAGQTSVTPPDETHLAAGSDFGIGDANADELLKIHNHGFESCPHMLCKEELLGWPNQIVPALGPMTCDPEGRSVTRLSRSIKGFLEKLEKASGNPEIIPEVEAQGEKPVAGVSLDSDKGSTMGIVGVKVVVWEILQGAPPPTLTTTGTAAKDDDSARSQMSSRAPRCKRAGALEAKSFGADARCRRMGSFEDEDRKMMTRICTRTLANRSVSTGKKQNNDNNKNGNEDNDDDWGTG